MSDTQPDVDLARVAALAEQIIEHQRELDRLYVERGDLLLAIRERPSPPPLSRLAAAAAVSVPAIIQQIDKAKARRA